MKQVEIACPTCGSRNRLDAPRAARAPALARCGSCGNRLFRPADEPLADLDHEQFVHPLDRKALATLGKVPGIETLLKWLLSEVSDRRGRILHLSTCVKLSEGQLPDVWRLYEKAATRLAISKLPDLFLYQSPVPQAYLLGVDEPVLALSSGLLDLLEEDELLGVMGHELTHWACQHALYRTAAVLLATVGGGIIGSLAPVGRAVLTPIRMALLEWMRSSELTADRGELIVTGSLDCSIRTLLKLSGGTVRYGQLSVDAFLEQAEMVEDEQEKSFVGRAMTFWIGMQATHPFAVWRAHHLKRFAHSQEFFEILAGRYRRLLPE